MLVSQSLVVTAPATMGVVFKILDASPYPRSLWLYNLDVTNTITAKVESSVDGGTTWVLVGTQFTIAAGAVSYQSLVNAGQLLRVSAYATGSPEMYVGLARFQIPGTGSTLLLLNL